MATKIRKTFAACLLCCNIVAATMVLTSCNDFLTIYPTDRIVGDDFWKTKDDVDQMVDGCYQAMLNYNVMERTIVWGGYRSDELVKFTDVVDNTLDNISAVNLLPTNRYTSWGDFYKVINYCNIVLNHAEDVMAEDPEFTMGDYQVVRAQMLALRSLCYFYLVRTFRDIPYSDQAFEDDTQVGPMPQFAPDVVLQNCLNDLEESRRYIMRSGAFGENDWRNKGYITRDAVHAIMADIYLWRAAMTHNTADYQQAIVFCDSVINAKHAYYEQHKTVTVTQDKKEDIYHLYRGTQAMANIFGQGGNSRESILEWQYNGRDNSNRALENYYYESGTEDNHKTTSTFMASLLFNSVDKTGKKFYISENDYRFWNNVFDANNMEADQLSVRKMVYNGTGYFEGEQGERREKSTSRAFREFQQNWIVYRLTDVMLMKAEALVETAANDSDQVALRNAFDLVQVVNKRSMKETATDTLKFDDYKSKSALEKLVLDERERELCFEGKRWWDLMRYCYRHMEGVNISVPIAEQTAWPALYKPMLELIVRKYASEGGGDAVSYKMKSEPYLYWPLQESETKVNPLLKQNPVYIVEKSTSKK